MPYRPSRLTVQWHITDRCNLRCKHCYQDAYAERGFDLDALQKIAAQVFDLRRQWAQEKPLPLLFTLTGGEPCSHPDFAALLEHLATHSPRPALAVLSNGSLIDIHWAELFSRLKVAFVQLSIEGKAQTHDAIRGPGSFDAVLHATRLLNAKRVRILWSFTAHRDNAGDFPAVAELAREYRVSRLWSDRLIPACHPDSRADMPAPLDAPQTLEYFQSMYLSKRKVEARRGNTTEIAMLRALQFQIAGGRPYRCTAGDELITLLPNGDVLPCRRLPVVVGNLLETPLAQIYEQAPLMQRLRQAEPPGPCRDCLYRDSCRGGLRCLAYAINGDAFTADPGCRHAELDAFSDPRQAGENGRGY